MRFAKAYVEITNICNRSCAFCPKTRRPPKFMTEAEFTRIAMQLRPYTEFLYFHVMGEPLLHPDLDRFLRIAGELGFRVILTTNGTLLDQVGDTLLHASALHKVNVSLHSFEANDGADMGKYLSSCIQFAKLAAEQGILLNFRLWNLDGTQTAGLHEKNDEILSALQAAFPQPWTVSRGGQRLFDHVYLSYGERFLWPSAEAEDYGERRFCYGLKDQIGVLCEGTVIPCCLDSEGAIRLGNLLEQEMEEILKSPRTTAIVEGFRKNRAVEPLCRRCQYSTRFSG